MFATRIALPAVAFAFAVASLVSCAPNASQLKKTLEENPDILVAAIQAHPSEFMTALQKASVDMEKVGAQKQAEAEKAEMDAEFKNPKKPEIGADRAIRNDKGVITIVEYSDFQCPYCQRGYFTVEEVRKKYGDKIRFVFKHLPLDFHPFAMPAAKRFEAIRLQSHEKAYAYHDFVFSHQQELGSKGEKFLDEAAKKAGANLAKMKKDMESEDVRKTIEGDMEEARKFEFSGTPGFIVGGVELKGAYPAEKFEEIIDRRLAEQGAK
jgi:protein-disulfide isomerase